jgi:hypothetical protein
MDTATKAFATLVDYQVGEVTAAATFYMAEIYANFSQSLRESERPADLGADGLKDYEQQLAAAAQPLEDKAIGVHQKNLELMRRGLNNVWTQKSLDRLAALKPDTYARTEISSGFLGSLERYVYQPPPRPVEAALGNPTAPAATQGATATEGAAAPAAVSGPAAASAPAAVSGPAATSAPAAVSGPAATSAPAAAAGPVDGAMGQTLTAGADNASSH